VASKTIILAQAGDTPGMSAVPTPQPTPPGEVHAAIEEHPGEDAGHGAFPPFDPATYGPQLLWLAITFGVLYLVLWKVVLPRIGGLLEERRGRIAADLAEAERLRAETDAAVAAYEQSLAEARANAHRIAGQARDEAKARTDAERARLEAGLAERLREAEGRIAEVKANALAQVDGIAEEVAEAMVETLSGSPADRPTIAAAVRSASPRRTG